MLPVSLPHFSEIYDIQKVFLVGTDRKLIEKHKRICRFCELQYPRVSFKNKAHIIPSFLGNKNDLSDFECDSCNNLFGRTYENDLANFLGINRVFTGTTKKGIPTLKSADRGLEIRGKKIGEVDAIAFMQNNLDENSFEWIDNNSLFVNFYKASFKPLNVYKAFLKIALSCLPQSEVKYYPQALKYLFSNTTDLAIAPFQYINVDNCLQVDNPFCVVFKKKKQLQSLPTHQISLYFNDKIISMLLPFHIKDVKEGLYEKHFLNPIPPPLVDVSTDRYEQIFLASDSLIKKELQKTFIRMKEPQNYSKLDPSTGKISETNFDPEKIKGVLLVPKGTTIPEGTIFDPRV